MRDRCIADEVITQLPRENLLSLVSHCAEGLHYVASPVFLPDKNLPAQIAVFAVRTEFVGEEVKSKVREMQQVVTVVATPIPPNMRVQVWCRSDFFATEWGRRFEPAFTPCEVGADIMRYLLRMVEGIERADMWQPKRVAQTTELSPLLQPITLNWRISELKRWVEDFRSDTNADIMLFHSEAKGYIDIYNTRPHPLVGMLCERPVNGAIELIPYLIEGATPDGIATLQTWRDALEAAIDERAGKQQTQAKPPTQFVSSPHIASGEVFGPTAVTVEPDEVVMPRILTQVERNMARTGLQSIRQGTLTVTKNTPHKLSRKPPGRKPDVENEEAYQMILAGGGGPEVTDRAYELWCERKNIKKPNQRDRDNFNVAMKRAAERALRGEPPAQ